jgi:predicted nucleic acid-binding protein
LHKLRTANVSLDSSVVVDFHLTGNLTLLEEIFAGRMLVSNFVTKEPAEADIKIHSAEEVVLSSDDEWDFFHDLLKRNQPLGQGELGAITVAKFRHATLLSNDKQARSAAEEEGIPISGAIGVLECAVEKESIQPTAAVAILEAMIREGAWISVELLELFRQRILHEN